MVVPILFASESSCYLTVEPPAPTDTYTDDSSVPTGAVQIEAFDEASTWSRALEPSGRTLVDDAHGHGLGWFVTDAPSGRAAWHTGHFAGFATVWLVQPDTGLVIAAVSNASTPGVADLALEILEHPAVAE